MPSLIPVESMSHPSTFTPSEEETVLVARLFARGEPHKLGVLTGDVALELFSKTNLSVQVLSDIWTIADKDAHGWLSPRQTAVAVRLIGWAQVGLVKLTPELLEKRASSPLPVGPTLLNTYLAGPLAKIPDAPSAGPSKIAPSPPVIPPISPADKVKFHQLFLRSGPVEGLVDGDKARGIFSKSKLPAEQLSQIWELSDTEHRHALDSKGFTIALHLIQGLMNNRFSIVPAFLPNELYEQAAAAIAEPPSPLLTTPTSPSIVSPNGQHLFVLTGSSRRNSQNGSPVSPRHTSESSFGWDIPSDVKAIANRQFDALDPLKNGFVHDNISLPFLLESKLPPEELARIWALSDLNGDGKLTREGFAVALYLIDERRRGNPLPTSRPSFSAAPGEQELQSPSSSEESSREPRLSPAENVQRQPPHVRYPAVPSKPSSMRFSSIWAPDNLSNSLGPPPTPDPAVAQLTPQVHEMQQLITQLRQSHIDNTVAITNLMRENGSLRVVVDELQTQVTSNDPESQRVVNHVLVKENEGLRASVQELTETVQQLQATSSEVEMQRIQFDDLLRENERLSDCVKEMRESTTQLPWSGGDSELQTLINEDLARENARLRSETREMQENVAQLQEATSDFEEQRRLNEELRRDNERMQAKMRTMQTRFDAQRTEAGQLSREIDRLKAQLRVSASARRSRTRTDDPDVPPPAYNVVDQSLLT
ncbi:hypothetical protein C8R47DRAFT_784541 [Mycena vitilis]|nr:hypothetical protein C8R47DRAFT_784541 [Mycena vitilis]